MKRGRGSIGGEGGSSTGVTRMPIFGHRQSRMSMTMRVSGESCTQELQAVNAHPSDWHLDDQNVFTCPARKALAADRTVAACQNTVWRILAPVFPAWMHSRYELKSALTNDEAPPDPVCSVPLIGNFSFQDQTANQTKPKVLVENDVF